MAPKGWVAALQQLGFCHEDVSENRETMPDPSIEIFLKTHNHSGVLLVLAKHHEKGGHLFPAEGKSFVDCHTSGKISSVRQPPIPAQLQGFSVRRVLGIKPEI